MSNEHEAEVLRRAREEGCSCTRCIVSGNVMICDEECDHCRNRRLEQQRQKEQEQPKPQPQPPKKPCNCARRKKGGRQ